MRKGTEKEHEKYKISLINKRINSIDERTKNITSSSGLTTVVEKRLMKEWKKQLKDQKEELNKTWKKQLEKQKKELQTQFEKEHDGEGLDEIDCGMDKSWITSASKKFKEEACDDEPGDDGYYTCWFQNMKSCQEVSTSKYVKFADIDSVTCDDRKCDTTMKKKTNICTKQRCSYVCGKFGEAGKKMCLVEKNKNNNAKIWEQLLTDCKPVHKYGTRIITTVPCKS